MLKHFHKAGKTLAVVLSVLMIAVLGLVSCGDTEAIDAANAKAEEALNAANAALTEEEVEALLNELLGDAYASAEDVDAITKKLANFITSADLNDYAKASVVTSIQSQLTTLTNAGNTNKTDIATIKTQLAALQSAMDALTGAAGEGDTTGNALTAAKKETMTALDDAKAALETKYPTEVDATIRETIGAYNDVDVLCAVSVAELNAITEAVSVYKDYTPLTDAITAANEVIDAVGSESAISTSGKVTVTPDGSKFKSTAIALTAGSVKDDMYIKAIVGTPAQVGTGKYTQYTFAETLVALKDIAAKQIFVKIDVEEGKMPTTGSYNGAKDTAAVNGAVLFNDEWYVMATAANVTAYELDNEYDIVNADGTTYAYSVVTINSKESLDAAAAAVAAIKATYTIADGDLAALKTDALDAATKDYNDAVLNAEKAVYTAGNAISKFLDTFKGTKASRLDGADVAAALGLTVDLDVVEDTYKATISVTKSAATLAAYNNAVLELAKVVDTAEVAGIEEFNEYVAALEENLNDAVVYAVEAALEAEAAELAADAAGAEKPETKAARNIVADYMAEIEALTVSADTFTADCDAIEAVANNCLAAVVDYVYYEAKFETLVEKVLENLTEGYQTKIDDVFTDIINTMLAVDETTDEDYNDQDLKVVDKKGQYDYEGKNDATEVDDFVMFLPTEKKFDPETAVAGMDETQTGYYNTVIALYNEICAIINDAVDYVEAYEVEGTYRAATDEIYAVAGNEDLIDMIAFGADSAKLAAEALKLDDNDATNDVKQTVFSAISNKFLSYKGEYVIVVPTETVTLKNGAEGIYAEFSGAELDVERVGVAHDLLNEDKFEELVDQYAATPEGYEYLLTVAHSKLVSDKYDAVMNWAAVEFDSMKPANGDDTNYVEFPYNSTTANDFYLASVKLSDDMIDAIVEYVESDVWALRVATEAAVTAEADVLAVLGNYYYESTTGVYNHIYYMVSSDVLAAYKAVVIEVLNGYLEEYEVGSRSTEGEKAFYDQLSTKVTALIAAVEAITYEEGANNETAFGNAIASVVGYSEKFEFNTLESAKKNLMKDLKDFEKWTLEATINLEILVDEVAEIVADLEDANVDDLEKLDKAGLDAEALALRKILLNSAYAEAIADLKAVTIVSGYGVADLSTIKAPKYVTYAAADAAVDALYTGAEGIVENAKKIVAGAVGYTGTNVDLTTTYEAVKAGFVAFKTANYVVKDELNAAEKLVNSYMDAYISADGKTGTLVALEKKYNKVDAMTISSFKAWKAAIAEIKAGFTAAVADDDKVQDAEKLAAKFANIYNEYDGYAAYYAELKLLADGADPVMATYAASVLKGFEFAYSDNYKNSYTTNAQYDVTSDKVEMTATVDVPGYDATEKVTMTTWTKAVGEADNKISSKIEWNDTTVTTYAIKDGAVDTTKTATVTMKDWYKAYADIYAQLTALKK